MMIWWRRATTQEQMAWAGGTGWSWATAYAAPPQASLIVVTAGMLADTVTPALVGDIITTSGGRA